MNADIHSHNNKLFNMIEIVFDRLIAINNKKFNQQLPESEFDLLKIPSISFKKFTKNIFKLWELEQTTLVCAIILLDRLVKESDFIITKNNSVVVSDMRK